MLTLACLSVLTTMDSDSFAIPINNNTALTAHKGEVIIREQIRYTRKSDDPSVLNRTEDKIVIPKSNIFKSFVSLIISASPRGFGHRKFYA